MVDRVANTLPLLAEGLLDVVCELEARDEAVGADEESLGDCDALD